MRAASTLTLIGYAFLFATSSVHALGFGRVTNTTQLGQPLNFAAAVRLEADELLPRECVSADVQSGDNKLAPAQVRVTLEGANDAAERSVRVTTSALIDEPVVSVTVTLGCGSKITRNFVAFIDPPSINAAQSVPLADLPPQRNDSQVAPLVRMVQGDNDAAPPRARATPVPRLRSRPVPAAGNVAESPAANDVGPRPVPTRRAATASRQSGTTRAAASGPRLKLDAAPDAMAGAASSPAELALAAATAEAASAVARADDQAQQLARERQRMQSLEDGLARLRSESQATQKSLADLQLRLKEAEAERYANPLVYALAWLAALLALAVVLLLWRQSRGRNTQQWWAAPAGAAAAGGVPRAAAADALSVPAPLEAMSTSSGAFDMSAVVDDYDPPPATSASTRPAPFIAAPLPVHVPLQPIVTAPAPLEPVRELSVEELIDLEQQVDFFIVLGQDDAAIELLMSHVRSDGGISPLPYLKLLEIYRRRGESESYERIRERFNRRFNAYAPDWDSDLQQGRALVDYPEIMARLEALWSAPTRVMETLDASVFRRNKSDETFDLPAYRELLFLYSIARDLAEHGGAASAYNDVDLLLPLGDDPGEEPISRLVATTAPGDFQSSDMMTMPLDLDVSFAPGKDPYEHAETAPAALRRTPEQPFPTDSTFLDFNLDDPLPRPGSTSRR